MDESWIDARIRLSNQLYATSLNIKGDTKMIAIQDYVTAKERLRINPLTTIKNELIIRELELRENRDYKHTDRYRIAKEDIEILKNRVSEF